MEYDPSFFMLGWRCAAHYTRLSANKLVERFHDSKGGEVSEVALGWFQDGVFAYRKAVERGYVEGGKSKAKIK